MKKQVFGLLVATLFLGYVESSAQSVQEKNQILNWRANNQQNVKLISSTDYQKLNAAEKAEIDALEAKIIYNAEHGLSWQDIQQYEASKDESKIAAQAAKKQAYEAANLNGNTQKGSYLSVKSEAELQEEKMKLEQVDIWRQENRHVKLVSMKDYQELSAKDRAYLNSITHKIIYVDRLTLEDIEAYEATLKQ